MMNRHAWLGRCALTGLVAWIIWGSTADARAHFLFIRVGPQAEGGRSAEVFFSEQAEAGDPRFIAKVAHTKLWVSTRPGEFRELRVNQGVDRLRAALPSDRTVVVVGECQYGVLARPNQPAFLLRYYPKAMAGSGVELNRLGPRKEGRFEIQPAFENDAPQESKDASSAGRIRLVALRDGKPIPSAVFTAVDSELSEQSIKAGPEGTALWAPAVPGRYSIYVRATIKQNGEFDGKQYDEIREFATLALEWPLQREQVDPEAVALFKQALEHRARWRDFRGFSAEISGQLDGRAFAGEVRVQRDGSVDVQTDDPVAKPWVKDQLESVVLHRLTAPADESGARSPRLRFADQAEDHPLGRLLAVEGDEMGSSYRIKDRQIMVVNRRMGKQNMTITVIDNETNSEGRILPHSYVVHYWDAASGKLNRVQTFQERSQRVGSSDLPVLRSVTTASEAGLSVRVVEFSKLKPLAAK
jgi:hypothetical protein